MATNINPTRLSNLISELLLSKSAWSSKIDLSITFTISERRYPSVDKGVLYSRTIDRFAEFLQSSMRQFRAVPEGLRGRFHYHAGGYIKNHKEFVKFIQFWQRNYGSVYATKSFGPLATCIYYRKEQYHRHFYPGYLNGEEWDGVRSFLPKRYWVLTDSSIKRFRNFREKLGRLYKTKKEKKKFHRRSCKDIMRILDVVSNISPFDKLEEFPAEI